MSQNIKYQLFYHIEENIFQTVALLGTPQSGSVMSTPIN